MNLLNLAYSLGKTIREGKPVLTNFDWNWTKDGTLKFTKHVCVTISVRRAFWACPGSWRAAWKETKKKFALFCWLELEIFGIQEDRRLFRHNTPYADHTNAITRDTQPSWPSTSRKCMVSNCMLMLAPALPWQKPVHQLWPLSKEWRASGFIFHLKFFQFCFRTYECFKDQVNWSSALVR